MGPPHERITLVRISLVTTSYSLANEVCLCTIELPQMHICLSAIFFDHDGVLPGRMKFYFLEPYPPRKNCLGENFFCHEGVFPGQIKFYFPKAPPPRENCLGENFFGHNGVFPGQIKFYFPKAPPHTKIVLVRISLVTTAYSLVESNFIFQKP